MKSIFLCKKALTVDRVYSNATKARINALAPLDTHVYTKEDIMANPDAVKDTEFIFSTWGMTAFTEDEIKAVFPSLKCVFYSAGTVQSFARPFINCGVKVYSAWAANAVPVAEFTVAQIILANKGYFSHARLLGKKDFQKSDTLKELCIGNYGERIGLVGCGMIGSLVAKMLLKHDLSVCVYDPFLSDERASELGVKKVSLKELFTACRVVSNHLPNKPSTVGMLNYELFEAMLPFATFINTGRGAQVVEVDLARVLAERSDLTALLDVTDPEPCKPDNPFYSLPNCFMSPHIAGSLGSELYRMSEYMIKELEAYLSGDRCKYEVTEKMLETMA